MYIIFTYITILGLNCLYSAVLYLNYFHIIQINAYSLYGIMFFTLQVYEDEKSIFLVMEYMRGGELLDRLHKLKFFSEREASAIMQVITSTICYLHKNGVRTVFSFYCS